MPKVYQHWKGTMVLTPRDVSADLIDTKVDQWFPKEAPEGARLLAREVVSTPAPLFNSIFRAILTIKLLFIKPKITLVADLRFSGEVEYFVYDSAE